MRRSRPLNIADVMIFVPAAGVSSLIIRVYMPGFYRQLALIPNFYGPDPYGLWHAYEWVHGPGSCVVVPLMAATLAIRLRRPRPRLVRFQPGYVACLAVMVSLLPGAAWFATIHHRKGFQSPQGFEQAWAITTWWTDTAVLGAWLALILARKWRPERSWIDRMGRALGLFWLILLFAVLALMGVQTLTNLLSRISS